MQTHGSRDRGVWESRQRMRRMIRQMTMCELRQQAVRQQKAERMLKRQVPGQPGARAVQRRLKHAIPVGMTPCRRMAAELQKMMPCR